MAEKKQKADKKQKSPYNLSTPVEAFDPSDPLGSVIFFGRKFSQDERDVLLTASISMTMSQITSLSLRFSDPGFKKMESGIFEPNRTVVFEDLRLQVGTVAVGADSGTEVLDVRCRPEIVRALKRRTGSKVIKGASPSDFVKSECKAIGAKFVVQDSPKRQQVARDNKRGKGDSQPPSSWTTFQRLSAELGYSMFEAANVLYFGKPTWLLERNTKNALVVDWQDSDDTRRPYTVPTCNRNEDTSDDGVTISVQLPYQHGIKFRPGGAMKFEGIPGFEGTYIVTKVDINLLDPQQPVNVEAGTPVDPQATKGKGAAGGTGNNGRTTSSLKYLLETKAGFKGEALDIAMAVAMAESNGDSQKYTKEDTTNTWAGYTGLFQIRALKEPGKANGLDARRIKSKLLDALYNAEFVYDLTNKGSNWSMFGTYTDGSYKKFFKKGDHTVSGWSVTLPPPKPSIATGATLGATAGTAGSVGTGATGARSAGAFVAKALSQSGKAYVFGAEASGASPSAFDCSELVEWAARMVGVYIPDGSSAQRAFCKSISVSQGIATRGALLFHPGHVAISLGNGSTIEAANPGFGVGSLGASGRFDGAGLIPGMNY